MNCKHNQGPDGKRRKTGQMRQEWQDDGYHGHRLDYALESAILKGFDIGEAVTPATLKTMFAETLAEIKKVME